LPFSAANQRSNSVSSACQGEVARVHSTATWGLVTLDGSAQAIDSSAPAAAAVPSSTLSTTRGCTASWARRHSSCRRASWCTASVKQPANTYQVTYETRSAGA
jgi:hypothetical protein